MLRTSDRASVRYSLGVGSDELTALVLQLQIRVAALESRPLTVAEAAERLGVTQKTVRRRIKAGTLAHTRTGRRVAIHLDRDPIAEFLA